MLLFCWLYQELLVFVHAMTNFHAFIMRLPYDNWMSTIWIYTISVGSSPQSARPVKTPMNKPRNPTHATRPVFCFLFSGYRATKLSSFIDWLTYSITGLIIDTSVFIPLLAAGVCTISTYAEVSVAWVFNMSACMGAWKVWSSKLRTSGSAWETIGYRYMYERWYANSNRQLYYRTMIWWVRHEELIKIAGHPKQISWN